ncbi:hypothetical protein PJL18_03888 [Paenarthrobacter nicotinovorans]|nr:hypothetical protein [Paenarthrobacter nicotinovorans]
MADFGEGIVFGTDDHGQFAGAVDGLDRRRNIIGAFGHLEAAVAEDSSHGRC